MKTLSQQIAELQEELAAKRDAVLEATKSLEEDGSEDAATVLEAVTAELEAGTKKLESLKRAEKALGTQAKPASEGGEQKSALITKYTSKPGDMDNLLGKMAIIAFESRVKGISQESVAFNRFGQNATTEALVKANQNPAFSDVAGYARELTQIAYGQFMDLLRDAAILPRATPLMQQHMFEGAASITVPFRAGTATQAAAAWRAEGAPIPVKGLTFSSLSLTPKNMGVILSATEEMLNRSSINLAAYFQNAIIADTGDYLDIEFVGNTAGSTTRPAGIRNGLPGGDTRAASGTGTTANIVADIKTMLTAMAQAKMGGAGARWIMSSKNWYTVSMALTATGSLQFPETANGMLANIPVLVTNAIADTLVLLVDFSHISAAFGSPQFMASNVATIHEDDVPLPISTGASGAGAITAAPVRSLFQTNSWALRLMMDCDWAKMRSGGLVQELSAVGWVG